MKNEQTSYSKLASLDMVALGNFPKSIGTFLLISLGLSIAILMFVPWRQSVVGNGEIIVFSPMQRPQNVEAQIPGRLMNWYVRDGQMVKQGQLIATLTDLDPRFLDSSQIETMRAQQDALKAKRDAAQQQVKGLQDQLADLHQSRNSAVPAASERILQAKERLYAAQQSVEAADQNVKTTQWQLDRISTLYSKGLRSQRDQQIAELDNIKAKTELQRAQAAQDVVVQDNTIAKLDYGRVSADTQASINAIEAAVANAQQTIASTNADISKLEIDIQNFAWRIAQKEVRSPCAGRVVRLLRVGAGETVTAGTVLAVAVPNTQDRAAALLVRDYDAPLVRIGRPVRLAISGWPSLQFVGWPSVAVGTFAGRVVVIDAVSDDKHYYRIIVMPDQEAIKKKEEQPWPSAAYLRPGAKASGWVLLNYVPLWYELWRQFCGFQPTVPAPQDAQ